MSNKKYSKRGISIIVVIVLLIVGLIAVRTNSLRHQKDEKESELATLQQKIVEAREETDSINKQIVYQQTDEFLAERAREDLGLVDQDDIILEPKNNE